MMTNVPFVRLWLLALLLVPVCGAQAQDMDQAQEIARLVEELGDDDPHVRQAATDKLIKIGEPALPAVRKAAESDDPEVSQRARRILGIVEMKSRLGLSDKLLRSMPDIYVQLTKGTSGADVYKVFAEVTEVDVKSMNLVHEFEMADAGKLAGLMAARGFSGMRNDEKMDFLRRCAGEIRLSDGSYIFFSGPDLHLPTTASHLVPLLEDGDTEVRQVAAGTLGNFGAKEHAPALVPLLKDGNEDVRWAAAAALGNLGAKEYVPDLVPLLKDGDAEVRRVAAGALGNLGAKEYVPDLMSLLKDGDDDVRSEAATALGKIGAKEVAPEIVPLLKDGNEGVRRVATGALVNLDAREHAPAIVPLLKDGDKWVRLVAAFALGKLGAKEHAPALVPLLKDGDDDVRLTTAEALGALGAKEYVPDLVPLLKDEDEWVRIVVGITLVELGKADVVAAAPDVVEEIKRVAEDKNNHSEETQARAARALEKLGAQQEAPKKER